MAAYENVRNLSAVTLVTAGVAAAAMYRFIEWDDAATEEFGVKTHVPGANGAASDGIGAMKPDTKIGDGYVAMLIAVPDGGQCVIELGEDASAGDDLRVGGDGAEVDGAAYLADAAGDVIVAKALTDGVAGQIIPIQYFGYRGEVPA